MTVFPDTRYSEGRSGREMKKILVVIGTLGRGGAEKQTYLLVNELKDVYKFKVVSFGDGEFANKLRGLGVEVRIIGEINTVLKFVSLVRIISEFRPDIIHAVALRAVAFCRLIKKLKLTGQGKLLVSERNTIKYKPRIFRWIDRLGIGAADIVIANSKYSAREFEIVLDGKELVVAVPNGILPDVLFEPRCYDQREFEYDMCYVANFFPRKNHAFLFDAFERLKKDMPDLTLALLGDGPLKADFEEMINSKKLAGVHFLGRRNDVPQVISKCRLYVHVSLFEGMSNAIMEAMMYGLPVLAFDVCSNEELVVNEKTGNLVPEGDVSAFCEKAKVLLEDSELRKNMSNSGVERIRTEYSVRKMTDETQSTYHFLLDCLPG